MKKIIIIISFMCILFIARAYGGEYDQGDGDVIIPPGMETIKEGDVSVVVPRGGQLRRQGSVMLIETADEYASRKFEDADNRFLKIERELEAQKKELEDLKSAVNKPEEDGRKK